MTVREGGRQLGVALWVWLVGTILIVLTFVLFAVLRVGEVEVERRVVENSRQYIISQQQHMLDLVADYNRLSGLIETDSANAAGYERQIDAVLIDLRATASLVDSEDVPLEAATLLRERG